MRNEYVERTSICEVIQDYDGHKWLARLADIENNRIVKFVFDEDAPWYFDNRNRLHFKDGPDEIGSIGVWHWTATPRDTDYEKDFIDSSFVVDIKPVKIIVLPEVSSLSMLAEKLKTGAPRADSGVQTLYCYSSKKTGYSGVLIQEQQLDSAGELVRLREDIVSLPLFNIDVSETIRTESQNIFLRSLTLPSSNENLLIKSPFEVIRGLILKRSSWAAVKGAGLTKGEYKRLRGYLTEITDNTLYEEIADACGFSVEEAKTQAGLFVKNIEQYLDGSAFDIRLIEYVVASYEPLRKKAEAIATENWQKENESMIASSKKEIEKYNHEIDEEKQKLKTLHDEVKAAQAALERIQGDISNQESVAYEVEQNILQRMENARKDVAEFIAGMMFAAPNNAQSTALATRRADEQSDDPCNTADHGIYKHGVILEDEGMDHHSSWKDALITIEDELFSAGVEKKLCAGLAAFLFSAWKNRVPLLLAGPNAADIVDAFSVAVYGRMADRLECSGNYSQIDIPTDIHEQIVIVKNMFQGNWIDHIPDILEDDSIYHVFVNPFVEDLAIEPKGLYNYMLPVFTDLFISNKPVHQYCGGKAGKGYTDFEAGAVTDRYSQLLYKNTASRLSVALIEHVIGDLTKMTGYRQDWDYYFSVVPYMIAIDHKEELKEHIRQEGRISKECKDIILNYLGSEE